MIGKLIVGAVVLALLAVGAFFAFGRANSSAAQAQPTATIPAVQASNSVTADAVVVPVASAALNWTTSDTVAELLVAEGDSVAQGEALARLDTRDLALRLEQAKVDLDSAEANYAKLQAGATPEEIAAAEVQIAEAQAQLRRTSGSVTGQDITAAQAQLAEAQARLTELQAGPKSAEQQSAQAALDKAQTNLAAQRNALSGAKTEAQLKLEQAANELRNAQDEYSRLYWDNEQLRNDMIKYGRGELPQELIDKEAAARRAVDNGEQALAQANLALEQARQAEITGIAAAEADVRDAEANLDKLTRGADADELAAARAAVAQARAELARLQGDERAGTLAASQVGVEAAQAELAKVTADPRAEDLAGAQVQIESAKLAIKQAELALERATLRAPMAGTIAELNLKLGEVPAQDEPAIVIADLARWQIETSDLTELSIVRIGEGSPVTITFDALPGYELPGTVTRIESVGKNKQGDITYTVVVTPTNWDARLRWNMTATVEIKAQ